MNPIQTELVDHNGTQCGFCTPGMVMSMYTLLANNPKPPERDIEDAFDGNLCRCTGYSSILSGCKTFACSQVKKRKIDSKNSVIFPTEFMKKQEKSLEFSGKRVTWHIPNCLDDLIVLKAKFPDAKILSGGTLVTIPGVKVYNGGISTLNFESRFICVYQVIGT